MSISKAFKQTEPAVCRLQAWINRCRPSLTPSNIYTVLAPEKKGAVKKGMIIERL